MSNSGIRILIADDHSVIRAGLRYLLTRNFQKLQIAEADACGTMMADLADVPFTHLILDLQLGDCNSIDVIPEIVSQYPELRVLVYTMSPEAIYGKRLVQMGVSGFLSKEEDEQRVVEALDSFLLKGTYLSENLKLSLLPEKGRSGPSANPFEELSDREMSVLLYLLQGLRVKEISNKLGLKISTVATYKVRIFEKLGVDNRADMQRLADIYHIG